MKKFIIGIATIVIVAAVGFLAYKCTSHEPTVEDYTLADKTYMSDSVSNDYQWFETCIQMTGNVDTLNTPSFSFVANIFQTYKGDATVYFGKHSGKHSWFETKSGHWAEDVNMLLCEKELITFNEAFEKLKEADCVKPKSAYCVLREPLGPKECNPQYIFGNDNAGVIFVDAVDGTVRTTNPAFDEVVTSTTLNDSIKVIIFK